MDFRAILATLALATTFAVGAVAPTRGDEPERPTGFSGYLLDFRGLEKKSDGSVWREDFESDGVSWRYLYQSGSVNVTKHRRVSDVARSGGRSEYLRYEVQEPGAVVFGHYVDYPNIYGETSPSLWVRSDRPGVSLAALVVFPKTLRPDNDLPVVALVPGSSYQKPGDWQELSFPDGLRKTLEKTVQSIRGENKIPLNAECAYIRQLVLISEARAGTYSLWIDDVEIKEHLSPAVGSLREWEQNSTFNPINLLSCRLKLSNAPIFGQDDFTDSDVYGREPFAIDQELVKRKNKRKLEFAADAVPDGSGTNVAETPLKKQFAVSPTFNTSSLFLQSQSDEAPPSIDEMIARRDSTSQDSPTTVGQASFMEFGDISKTIAPVAFSPADQESGGDSVSTSGGQAQENLIVGSGTLADPEDAATESFRRRDDRLVADAKFRAGLLETPDGRNIYSIRAIEYQGESFAFLKQLGFNAIWLSGAPSAKQLYDAEELGIWLVAAPPVGANLVSEGDVERVKSEEKTRQNNASEKQKTLTEDTFELRRYANVAGSDESIFGGVKISSAYDPVLLWNMGSGLKTSSMTALQSDLRTTRSLDPLGRPIIGAVETGVDAYSQEGRLDALMLAREPLQSSLEMNDYGEWLVKYQQLATNSRAVFWNRIQTQPTASATLQRQFCGMADESPGVVSYEQMRQLVRLSMRAKCRGLLFSSYSPLDAKDHKTQYRATALEAINLELQLIEPWFALGEPEPELIETSEPSIGGILSKTKRSLLFVPVSLESNNQYVMGRDAADNLSATAPAREGYSPDLLVPGALRKIVSRRRAGGCCFILEDGSMNSLLFFTQSDSLSQKTLERAPAYGKRLAKLAISLARKRLDLYEQTVYSLRYVEERGYFPKSAPKSPALGEMVEKIAKQIDEAEIFLQRRDASQAYLAAERATREIREIERNFWLAATRNEITRPVTPLSTTFYDMPAYLELYDKLVSGKLQPLGNNLIAGGDMENQETFQNGGWRVFVEESALAGSVVLDGYSPETDTSPDGVKRPAGRVLKLKVVPKPGYENKIPQQTETATVSVETAFNAKMGQMICFQGWIKIPEELSNSVDGVEIYDDQGGRGLALRFKKAMGWTRFAFYRLSVNDGPMRIRIAMSGVGEVWLDDVAAYSLGSPHSEVEQ